MTGPARRPTCELHGLPLQPGHASILYGLPGGPWYGAWSNATRAMFPHSNSRTLGGCTIRFPSPPVDEVLFCPSCREVEREWERERIARHRAEDAARKRRWAWLREFPDAPGSVGKPPATTSTMRLPAPTPDDLQRHTSVYATPKLPKFEFTELDDTLVAGRNPLTAVDVAEILGRGVTHVLDLREDHEWSAPGRFGQEAVELLEGAQMRTSLVVADLSPPTPDVFDRAVEWIDRVLEQPGARVYVHCRAGHERTGAVVAAYLARSGGVAVDDALEWFREKRSAQPLPDQVRATREWAARHAEDASGLRSRVRGCLLGGAIGDALGAGIEFDHLATIRERFGPAGVTSYVRAYGRKGAITDDTQMTLCSAEAIIRSSVARRHGRDLDPTRASWAAYRRWIVTQLGRKSDDVTLDGWLISNDVLHRSRAPGNTCIASLRGGRPGSPAAPINDSKGCGGVMRAAPYGLWPAIPAETAFELGRDAAALTHTHATGYLSAGALAFLVRRLIDGETLPAAASQVLTELARHARHEETTAALRAAIDLAAVGDPTPERVQTLGGGWTGEEALAIGLYAALVATDVRHGLLLAVNHTGDSDSTGSIAGNLLGAQHGVAALPVDLLMGLEARHVVTRVADDLVREATDPPATGDAGWEARYPGA